MFFWGRKFQKKPTEKGLMYYQIHVLVAKEMNFPNTSSVCTIQINPKYNATGNRKSH